jgi:hypothetical protein
LYQGTRLHLAVNHYAAGELAELLSDAARDPSRSPMLRRLSLLLPDGRELDVTVQVTNTGAVYDASGDWVDDDGRAYVDISGDFRQHAAARSVMDIADLPYLGGTDHDQAAADDEQRIRAHLDHHLPSLPGDGNRELLRDDVYRRAIALAESTRAERLADAERMAEQMARARAGDSRGGWSL